MPKTPSEWCRYMWETTFDKAYIELYEFWKEREDAKVLSDRGVSES